MRKFIIPCSSLLLILTFNALADDNTSGQWSRDRAMDGQNREMPDHFRRTQRENLAMHRGTREYKRASPEKKNETDRLVSRAQILNERYDGGRISREDWARQHQMPIDHWERRYRIERPRFPLKAVVRAVVREGLGSSA
jgi:hypothetical protein